ncbi:unnamed protein product [Ilex paraguariensis]|uniref:RRM domain-containing protein n=1 Tax=Ilex paraguariensis TaxID=185542 RepID=A0ABC8T2C1_9AQUA
MAILRLLCFPSTTIFSTQQLLSPTPSPSSLHKPPQANNSFFPPPLLLSVPSFSPLSHTLPLKSQKPNFFFHLLSSSQAQATIETPELEQSEPKEGGGVEEVEQEQEEDESSRTRVLAQNVPWSSTPDDLRPLFQKYGTVVDIELSMFNKTRNRGLAFVTMGSHEEALAAINNLEAYELEGRVLKLEWARPKKKKPSSPTRPKPVPIHNLFVANLPFQARANDLKEFFNAENANVVSAEIIFLDNPRRSAGYGFVSFNSKEEAESTLSAFQGKEFMGRQIRVARSKRFLRQGTKANIESEINLSKSSPEDGSERT